MRTEKLTEGHFEAFSQSHGFESQLLIFLVVFFIPLYSSLGYFMGDIQ